MLRYFIVGVLILSLHAYAALFRLPYREFLLDIGLRVTRGNDIADIPTAFVVGFSIVGAPALVIALAVVYALSPKQK